MVVDIEEWRKKIEQALRYKEDYGRCADWALYRGYCRGDFPGFTNDSKSILPYNLTFGMKQALIPQLYFRNPYVMASPRSKPGMYTTSKIAESLLNWLIQELEIKKTFRLGITDAFQCGRAIFKIGYDSEYGTQRGKKGSEWDTSIKGGFPWVKRIDPYNILVPFGVRELIDCEWLDHMFLRKTSLVKSDKRYKGVRDLKGSHLEKSLLMKGREKFFQELSETDDYTELHEIRDVANQQVFILLLGGAERGDLVVLGPEEDILQIEGLNYTDFCFNDDPDFYWAPSDARIIQPQQLEMNELRTQAMYHRRVALLKFLVEENGMDRGEADKLLSDSVGPVIFTKGNPATTVSILQPHIPPDLIQFGTVIREDVREILGWSRQSLGEAPPGRRTAKEMGIVEQAHSARMDDKRDSVADCLQKTLRKVFQLVLKFWSVPMVTQVVGYDGAKYWVKMDEKQITDEYDIKIDVESMMPTTKQTRRQELVQLIQALANNPRANLDYLLRLLLREFEWIDAMKVLPEAPEMQGGPMGMQQYQQQQAGLLENPARLKQRVGGTAKALTVGAPNAYL